MTAARSAGLPTPLPLRAGEDVAAVVPGLPQRLTVGEGVGTTAAAALGGAGYGAVSMFGLCLPGGPIALFCIPVGAAVGATIGLGAGVIGTAPNIHGEEPILAAADVLRRRLDPDRVATCLRDTMVARSEGRLMPVTTRAAPMLEAGLAGLSLTRTADGSDADPRLVLTVSVGAAVALPDRPPGSLPPRGLKGTWSWNSAPRRYFDWAAEGGAALEAELGLAIGVLAQRILSELYPGEVPAPPGPRGSARQALRVGCTTPGG